MKVVGKKKALEITASDVSVGQLPGEVEVVAASIATGRQLLTTVDEFVSNQSPFDRQARLNLRAQTVEVTLAMYFDYVSSQVMGWSQEELAALQQIVASMAVKFASMKLELPKKIYLVKTSGQEEGFAAYTRRKDTICLPANMVNSLETSVSYGDPLHPANDQSYLEDVLIHECFHLFSKNHPLRRYQLYSLLHYRPTDGEVQLPNVPWGPAGAGYTLPELKITNPDTPLLDVYIEMDVPETPGAAGALVRKPLMPVLLANGPYEGGIFFDYLVWWFMALEKSPEGRWVAAMKEGKPLLYESKPLLPQYLSLVGRNFDNEIFHPDEIMAQSFVLVANQPSLSLLSSMQGMLEKGA